MTTTAQLSRITFAERPAHIQDNTPEPIRSNSTMTAEQNLAYAASIATDMNKVMNRWIKWFRACHVYSTAVAATGIYNRPHTSAEYRQNLIDNGLLGGPEGRRPADASSHRLYDHARSLRTALVNAGIDGDPGRPHTMEGLDNILTWAYAQLGKTRKVA